MNLKGAEIMKKMLILTLTSLLVISLLTPAVWGKDVIDTHIGKL